MKNLYLRLKILILNKDKTMKRKDFLKNFSLGILTVPTVLTSCGAPKFMTNIEDCKLTDEDDLGPFFVKNTPQIVNLNTKNENGVKMRVIGKVFRGEFEDKPLADTKIEIWHCDDQGKYHPSGNGDVSNYEISEIGLRGHVITQADGSYIFDSILPGLYGSRARHIHFKLTSKKHSTLVTQSYFKGDKRIPHDSLAQNSGDCRIIEFKTNSQNILQGEMNFHL